MSAPNKNYDPVEVTALTAEEVERATTVALTTISGARTLDELKEARVAHAGDKAPLSLARAEIGALPPQARSDAGRRVGAAVARVWVALS
ncbi:MAG: pheS, partial [Actinomycetia bacterium]|nr:pheS [Actinomycetes bacterium]